VTDGPLVTVGGRLELIVGDGVEVEVELAVEVDVEVDGFVDELDEEVFEDEPVAEDVEVVDAAGASFVGGVDVPDAIGVLEGSDGRLTERDVLGRLEPPPHATINIREMAHSAITRDGSHPFASSVCPRRTIQGCYNKRALLVTSNLRWPLRFPRGRTTRRGAIFRDGVGFLGPFLEGTGVARCRSAHPGLSRAQ
jgi:hypothetical protein